MWLINATTLRLEGFKGLEPPEYAILSHRWGDEEVTFQDISDGQPEGKKGYQKIQGAAAQARMEGLAYIWVDTCCIDKTSSAELSEAINSMFAWYRDASICYAYLDDVPSQVRGLRDIPPDDKLTDKELEEVLRSPFAKSKWFTRGWTLQEFIAPWEVKFYNCQWQGIGTKRQLKRMLRHITGIDEDIIIHQRELRDVCVARKMSWAARRTTTRIEDTAYCLLGLFDIHLPLLYGEGANAFIRLQQEIIRVSDDQSIFAWNSASYLSLSDKGLFAPRPQYFFNAGRIVLWEARRGDEPWALTNYGLRLQLPLVRERFPRSQADVAAVLACRYEDDFTGPLGLMLRDTDSPTVFNPSVTPRLVILDREQANKAEMKTLYLSTHQGPTSWSGKGIEPNRKCWVRFSVPLSSGWPDFEVQAAFPSQCWNTTTKTMRVRHSNEVKGALHLRNRDGKEFVVAFGYEEPGWQTPSIIGRKRLWVDFGPKMWVRLIQREEEQSLGQLCDMANPIDLAITDPSRPTSTYRPPDGLWEATACIQEEVIMDEKLYTVDVKIVDGVDEGRREEESCASW
jgi:hypothetical protein